MNAEMDAETWRLLAAERDARRAQIRSDRDELERIERAIVRLDRGTYGCCISCGNRIESTRLAADPGSELCTGCDAFRLEPLAWPGFEDGPYW